MQWSVLPIKLFGNYNLNGTSKARLTILDPYLLAQERIRYMEIVYPLKFNSIFIYTADFGKQQFDLWNFE